jgi:hypothetical protein
MRSALYTAPIAVAMVSFFIGRCVFRAYFYALSHLTWIIEADLTWQIGS